MTGMRTYHEEIKTCVLMKNKQASASSLTIIYPLKPIFPALDLNVKKPFGAVETADLQQGCAANKSA